MRIEDILDINKTPIFACIGAKYSFYDNTANRIGYKLKEHELKAVINFNNINMQEKLEELETLISTVDNPQIIALDLSHSFKHKKKYYCYNTGILPGSGLGYVHKEIGDVCIKIMLNAFEDIQDKADILVALSKERGNRDIFNTETKIANRICDFYGV